MCMFLPFCYRISVGLTTYSIGVLSNQRYTVTFNSLHVRVSSNQHLFLLSLQFLERGFWLHYLLFLQLITIFLWWLFCIPAYKLFSTFRYISTLIVLCISSVCDCLHLHHDCPPSSGML